MLYPHITVDDVIKSGWIGDDIQLQPKIKITHTPMEQVIFDDVRGKMPEKSTWYDRHGLPNPDRPDQILAHREKLEKERQEQREDDLWKEVSKNFKANIEVAEVENDKFLEWDGVSSQCVQNFGDVKIGFKK